MSLLGGTPAPDPELYFVDEVEEDWPTAIEKGKNEV